MMCPLYLDLAAECRAEVLSFLQGRHIKTREEQMYEWAWLENTYVWITPMTAAFIDLKSTKRFYLDKNKYLTS